MSKRDFYGKGHGKVILRGKEVIIPKTLKAKKAKKIEGEYRSDKLYHSGIWWKVRQSYIKANPLCAIAYAQGKLIPAALIHHIHPLDPDMGEQLDSRNLISLSGEFQHRAIHRYIEELREKNQLPWDLYPGDFEKIRQVFLDWGKDRGGI